MDEQPEDTEELASFQNRGGGGIAEVRGLRGGPTEAEAAVGEEKRQITAKFKLFAAAKVLWNS